MRYSTQLAKENNRVITKSSSFSYLLGVEAELGLDGLEVSGAQGSAVDTVRASLAGALANHRADLLAMER